MAAIRGKICGNEMQALACSRMLAWVFSNAANFQCKRQRGSLGNVEISRVDCLGCLVMIALLVHAALS